MSGNHTVDVDIAEGSPQGSQRESHFVNDDLQSLQQQLAEFEEENAVLSMENQMLEAFYERVAHEIGEELRRQAELHSNDGLAGKKKAPKKEKKDEGLQTLSIEQKQRCAQIVFESNTKVLERMRADRESVRFSCTSHLFDDSVGVAICLNHSSAYDLHSLPKNRILMRLRLQ
jgi:hypothetical protein